MRPSPLVIAAVAALLAACAPTPIAPVAPPPAPTCSAVAAPSPPPLPVPPPAPVPSATATPVASAPPEPAPPPPAFQTAFAAATRFAAAGDFERAAGAFVAVIPELARHPERPDEFWAHNAMMMIREAQGDPAAALAENDQATLCAERGTWDPQGRANLAFQKDRWHRAYLTRMLAESRTGTAKQGLVQYAQAALDEYRVKGFPDSVAILDAYFAALDGRRDAALAAARRVDPAKDDDVEDLYLVVVGLEAGGDHAGAEAVRRLMRRPGGSHIARAIMLHWLDLDAKGRGFTPWHAGAR
jgi:hypothetical protein